MKRSMTLGWLPAVLLIGALSSSASSHPVAGGDDPVTTVNAVEGAAPGTWAWEPADVTISAGERVVWRNETTSAHGLSAWDGRWKVTTPIDAGDSAGLRFRKPGVYSYRCPVQLHSDVLYIGTERVCVGMCGTVTVE